LSVEPAESVEEVKRRRKVGSAIFEKYVGLFPTRGNEKEMKNASESEK
jgi:hypothetical protein